MLERYVFGENLIFDVPSTDVHIEGFNDVSGSIRVDEWHCEAEGDNLYVSFKGVFLGDGVKDDQEYEITGNVEGDVWTLMSNPSDWLYYDFTFKTLNCEKK